MKKNTMKKLLAASLSLSLALSLAACSGGSSSSAQDPAGSGEAAPADGGYKIAVVRQLDHASMNEIRDAIFAELDAKAAELSLTISYEDFNGNNDTSTLSQIGAQILADQYDAIIPIGTLAAQQMVSVAEESQTPVIYGTVSYPEVANLTGIDYVTGTSDALNVELLLDMMLAADPDIQTVGLLYSTSEVNSAPAIEDAKAYLDETGVSYLEKTGTTSDEIIAAVNSMLGQVDAVFTPTDNAVQATELAIAPILAEAGIPHYAGADSFVRNGAFATCGVNYTDLGTQTADLALEVLQTGEFPEYVTVSGDIITVNTDTAATPVSSAETVNSAGRSQVFHSGMAGAALSSTPVYAATASEHGMPTMASTLLMPARARPNGLHTLPSQSASLSVVNSALSTNTTNVTSRSQAPMVIQDDPLTKLLNRIMAWKGFSTSDTSANRPMAKAATAVHTPPVTVFLNRSGFTRRRMDTVRNAPALRPPRNR